MLWIRRGLLVSVALASLFASVQNLARTPDLGSLKDDAVADWVERFDPIKARLPFQRGVVGYISDAQVPGIEFNSADELGEYVLSQYALAPIILERGARREWCIANLSRQAYKTWSSTNQSIFDVVWSGRGLYLLHRVAT
jgi:hypothetical protein